MHNHRVAVSFVANQDVSLDHIVGDARVHNIELGSQCCSLGSSHFGGEPDTMQRRLRSNSLDHFFFFLVATKKLLLKKVVYTGRFPCNRPPIPLSGGR